MTKRRTDEQPADPRAAEPRAPTPQTGSPQSVPNNRLARPEDANRRTRQSDRPVNALPDPKLSADACARQAAIPHLPL